MRNSMSGRGKQSVGSGPAVVQTDLKGLGPRRQGKVRDIYDLGDTLLLIATDRISAFDVVLPDPIPGKGILLTQMSAFWFNWLWAMEDVVPHHMITTKIEEFPASCHPYREQLAGRSMLVQKVAPLPVECIVRGYLAGSGWKEYKTSGTVCGLPLPAGLAESAKLPEPIFTPSTKAISGHDENITFQDAAARVGDATAKEIREASLKIYQRAAAYAEQRGILIADTKFEFGIAPGTQQLVLFDEVLTPPASGRRTATGPAAPNRVSTSNSCGMRSMRRAGTTSRRPPIFRRPSLNKRPTNIGKRSAG
jgi:phosphoribosylaminoimidazole-succinocarboxamide synthase